MGGLQDQIDSILSREREPSAALAALRRSIPLASFFLSCCADSGRLAALAARSYRHDNGFEKIVLGRASGSPLKLVLHVWKADDASESDNIHNHRWEFASIVLRGALRLDLYEADPDGESYPVLRYLSPGEGNAYRLEPAGSMAVSVSASVTLAAGSAYSWTAGLLHRAQGAGTPFTATLIVQGSPTRESTTVLARANLAPDSLSGEQRLRRLLPEDIGLTLSLLTDHNVTAAWLDEAV